MTFLCSLRTYALQLTSGSTNLTRVLASPALGSSFHTSAMLDSRIKWRHTHKPFFFTKKTAKHPDTPITLANKKFLEEVVQDTYSSSPLRFLYFMTICINPGYHFTRTSALVAQNLELLFTNIDTGFKLFTFHI